MKAGRPLSCTQTRDELLCTYRRRGPLNDAGRYGVAVSGGVPASIERR